MDTTSDP